MAKGDKEKKKEAEAAFGKSITAEELDRIETRAEAGDVSAEDVRMLVTALREALSRDSGKAVGRKTSGKKKQPVAEQEIDDVPDDPSQPPRVSLYTDGACLGNPGPGGWGAVLQYGGREKELSGYEPDTTNNRMELTAVVQGLNALRKPSVVTVTTDSQYVQKGITAWIHTWKRNGWRTSARTPVKNEDLWRALDTATLRHRITWQWVRGHSGHPENERCDQLAREAIRKV